MSSMTDYKKQLKAKRDLESRRYFAQQKSQKKVNQKYSDTSEFSAMSVVRRHEDCILFVASRKRNIAESIYPDSSKDKYVSISGHSLNGFVVTYKFNPQNFYEMDLKSYPILDEDGEVKYFFEGLWGGTKRLIDYQSMMLAEPKKYARNLLKHRYSRKYSDIFSDFGIDERNNKKRLLNALNEYEAFKPKPKSIRSFLVASLCEKLKYFPRDMKKGVFELEFKDRIDIAIFVHYHNRSVVYGPFHSSSHYKSNIKPYRVQKGIVVDRSNLKNPKAPRKARDEEKMIMLEKAMQISELAAYVLVKSNFNARDVMFMLNEVNSGKRKSRKIWNQRAKEYFASNPNIFGRKRKAEIDVSKIKIGKERNSQENDLSTCAVRI